MTTPACEVVVRDARMPGEADVVRTLFEEYAAAIGVDLCFQGFAEELATLSGKYALPGGCLLVAGNAGIHGCIALRPLAVEPGGRRIGEVKRLYVRPSARGTGAGRALARALIARARAQRYAELKLDTLNTMHAARELYASLGFRECAPYYVNPLPDVAYLSLALA